MPRIIALFLLLILPLFAHGTSLKPENVPPDLKPWVGWALQDAQDYQCPFWYYNYQQKRCTWPTHLSLELTGKQGKFSSHWQIYKEGWGALPGGDKFWPQTVTANDKPVLVMNRQGIPMAKLNAGVYEIKGSFFWDNIPESLIIPQNSGVVDLSINGKTVPFPAIKDGAIWLKESDVGQKKLEAVENKWDLQVFRQVNDDVPLQLITFLELEVSGQQREIKLPHALLADFIPIKLQSPLPAKIEPDGSLSLQVRPGRWHIELYARYPKSVDAVSLKFKDKTWPESEIWVFNAQPYQRLVEVQNLQPIDPNQSNLPEEWKTLPAFQVLQGETMGLKVIRRGDPEPEPNHLVLNRELWLDFEGKGYTIQDNISGKMTSGWRLNALPETQLGQVKLNEENQLITQIAGSAQQGVEVRKGELTLKADSRYLGDIGKMSAVGWAQSFHQVTATLRLPPGWRLLAVSGVDNDPNCWISNWTLLDLFLVLMASLAIGHLWGIYWGSFALVSLALIWHEAAAPQYIWLNILVALALIKVLPEGKILKFVRWYRNACWLGLVLIVIPFAIDQVRMGIYPQLEKPWQPISEGVPGQVASSDADEAAAPASPAAAAPVPAAAAMDEVTAGIQPPEEMQPMQKNAVEPEVKAKADAKAGIEAEMARLESAKSGYSAMSRRSLMKPKSQAKSIDYYEQKSTNFNRIDPNANVQTGLGSPQWQWNQVQLSWNGAVNSEQILRFWYLSPTAVMLLNFVRVIFVLVLAALMFGWEKKINLKTILPIFIWLSILPLTTLPTEKAYADFPDQTLLDQLKNRLTEAPDCLPNCAEIPAMKVAITPEKMTVSLQVHAQQNVALPLPSRYKEWFPNQVSVDGKIATAMLRDESGSLWLNVSAGEHQIVMLGINPEHNKFTLPLPLKPHYVSSEATGWLIEGIHENGEAENQLQFNRVQSGSQKQNTKQNLEQGALPPFITLERTLELGLDWRLTTRINRVMSTDSAVLVELPLLKGESVTTPEVRVKNGKVQVSMSANQDSFEWVSILEKSEKIELTAAQTSQWTEVWRADVSPIWHLQTGGISVVHHQNQEGFWLPEWRPWPGEKVTLTISRPNAIEGRTSTVDSSHLQLTPGKRSQEGSLTLKIRSSKGTQHTITLPEKAELQSVLIDSVPQPIRQKGSAVTLPIKPGEQQVILNWQQIQEQGILLRSPVVNLGKDWDSVNTHINIRLGEDRWVLVTAGPRFGPAVLFWGVIVVIGIVSIGLGKIPTTPIKQWQWFLLLIGLSQINLTSALIVVAWLIVLGIRAQQIPERTYYFNAMQIGLIVITLISLSLLFTAVKQGLLGAPDMQIAGNQSSMFDLNWYQDRSGEQLPIATVISLPVMAYRVLMLGWSLWLAMALLNWLKWGWRCFAKEGLWKERVVEKKSLAVESEEK